MAPTSILYYKEVGHSQEGSQEVNKLMDAGVFDGPKPQRLMERLLTLANLDDDSIILDFFSGSGSMGHATMKFNAEKDKHCKFILVQLPEDTDDKANKAGYETICQIGEERIRRAGKKVKEEAGLHGHDLDTGFRVLKLDSSNMEDVFYTPEDFNEADLFNTVDNVKSDRTPLDLLFKLCRNSTSNFPQRLRKRKSMVKRYSSWTTLISSLLSTPKSTNQLLPR